MDVYACLLFDSESARIGGVRILTARDRIAARSKALILVGDTPGATGFELWLDGEKVSSYVPVENRKPAG